VLCLYLYLLILCKSCIFCYCIVIVLCIFFLFIGSWFFDVYCRTIIYCEQHVLLMWSVAFYVAENFVHELGEIDFVSRLFQVKIT